MELVKIEDLLEKYFQGETSIAEENELRNYFSSSNVAQHLEQLQTFIWVFLSCKRASVYARNSNTPEASG